MEQHIANPNTAIAPTTGTDTLGPVAKYLYDLAVIFNGAKNKYSKEEISRLFQFEITTQSRAKKAFAYLEKNYLKYILNKVSFHYDHKVMVTAYKLMRVDPFGRANYPKTADGGMWKVEKQPRDHPTKKTVYVNTAVKTTLHKTLDILWLEFYMILRSSLRLWMNDSACDNVRRAIQNRENGLLPPLEDKDLLDKDRRTTWEWIKNHVYEHVCVLSTGDYHYMPLQTASRFDGDTRTTWCNRIQAIWKSVQKFGQSWDALPDASYVQKLWDWLSRDEQNVVLEVFEKHKTAARQHKTR